MKYVYFYRAVLCVLWRGLKNLGLMCRGKERLSRHELDYVFVLCGFEKTCKIALKDRHYAKMIEYLVVNREIEMCFCRMCSFKRVIEQDFM